MTYYLASGSDIMPQIKRLGVTKQWCTTGDGKSSQTKGEAPQGVCAPLIPENNALISPSPCK